jgi:hypothetical protein
MRLTRVVKGKLTVFGSVGISIAAVGGCTEPPTAIQRIATLRESRWIDKYLLMSLINLQG